jgi:hypothetical protein
MGYAEYVKGEEFDTAIFREICPSKMYQEGALVIESGDRTSASMFYVASGAISISVVDGACDHH